MCEAIQAPVYCKVPVSLEDGLSSSEIIWSYIILSYWSGIKWLNMRDTFSITEKEKEIVPVLQGLQSCVLEALNFAAK